MRVPGFPNSRAGIGDLETTSFPARLGLFAVPRSQRYNAFGRESHKERDDEGGVLKRQLRLLGLALVVLPDVEVEQREHFDHTFVEDGFVARSSAR